MNVTLTPQIRNYNINFRGRYTVAEICADLCKGACCNHGTPMNATLKKIADKFNATYYQLPDDLKSSALIKAPILNWVIDSSDIEAKRVDELANVYIDAISRENNPQKIEVLKEALELLNQKLESMLGKDEAFLSITNPILTKNPQAALMSNTVNPCAFKDHGKTNKCN